MDGRVLSEFSPPIRAVLFAYAPRSGLVVKSGSRQCQMEVRLAIDADDAYSVGDGGLLVLLLSFAVESCCSRITVSILSCLHSHYELAFSSELFPVHEW